MSSAISKKPSTNYWIWDCYYIYPYFKSWTWNSILSELAAQSIPKQQAKVLCLVSWPWLTLPHATFFKPSPKCRVFWENKWKHHDNRTLSELIIMFAMFYWKWTICLKPSSHPPQHDATLNSHQHSSRRGTCIGGNISPFTQSVKVINLPATSMKLAGRWWWLATSPMGSWIYKIPRLWRGLSRMKAAKRPTIKLNRWRNKSWNKKRQSSNSNMPIIWTRNKNFLSWEYLY